jgi:anti-sigma B factor antagonist
VHNTTPRPLTITTRAAGQCVTVAVTGAIDAVTTPTFTDAMATAVRAQPSVLLLDLTAVDFFGSHAVRALLNAYHHTLAHDARLVVVCAGIVDRVLAITGTRSMFEIHPTTEHAHRALETSKGVTCR